jgi:hypothetical protein
MLKLYRSGSSQKNTNAIRLLSNVAREYYKTGDEQIAKTFLEMLRIFDREYNGALNWRKTPPSFRFEELPRSVNLVEGSNSFTGKEMVFCANVLRKVTEHCMDYWEMREPMKLYNSGTIKYLTNHPLFASRGISAASIYLLERFNIPAAKYWDAVSTHAYKGIEQSKQGPEDAGSYQWICRRLYTEFCICSGRLPYNTQNMRYYIDYALAHFNQMGVGVGYGDTPPLSVISGWSFLKFGKLLYDDKLCEYMLARIKNEYVKKAVANMNLNPEVKFEPRMLGLTVFPLDKFLVKYFNIGGIYKNTPLNKAVFRSGYSPASEYLMLGGLNTLAVHGHRDANAIVQYSRGDRYWLIDGDYIKSFPREHNSMIISGNGKVPDQRRISRYRRDSFAELDMDAASPNGEQGITVTSLRNHAGLDWSRNIFWNSLNGFWVIDQLVAVKAGQYVTKCLWRTLGDVSVKDNTVKVVQKKSQDSEIPDTMFIARGDKAATFVTEQLDYGHGGEFGYYDSYKFASPVTKVITELKESSLSEGQQVDYVNFFMTQTGEKTPEVRRVGRNAWIMSGDKAQFVSTGNFESPELKVKADRILISENGICAVTLSKLEIGGKAVKLSGCKNFYSDFGRGSLKNIQFKNFQVIAQRLFHETKTIQISKLRAINVVAFNAEKVIKTNMSLTAMVTSSNRIVCGFSNGTVVAYNEQGGKLWDLKMNAPITALCAVVNAGATYWAVGTRYDNRKSQKGFVVLISDKGKICWQKKIMPYHGRPGTVRTIIAAKLRPGSKQQVVAGTEAWKYVAFDQKGNRIWTFPVFHAATVSAAGDMTGNGLDEVALGTEYPYHWIVNSRGKKLKAILSSPGDWTVKVADINGDGRKEAIWGREDGYIKVMRPCKSEKRYMWEANVGGLPTGIEVLPGKRIAVSTENNSVVFLSASGNRIKTVYLPEYLLGIKLAGKSLYAACRDGYVYKLSAQGTVVAKYEVPDFKNSLMRLFLGEVSGRLIVGFDKTISIF